MITIVNKYKDKYEQYGGRGSMFGNPFVIGVDGTRDEVCDMYEDYFLKRVEQDVEFRASVLELVGKTVGCFCVPKRCHLETIKRWLEKNVAT